MGKNMGTAKEHRVWTKANGLCAHCGRNVSSRYRTIDHVVPKSDGGGYDYRNLMPLCKTCNQRKSSNWIDPSSFYIYAKEDEIRESEIYMAEWIEARTNSEGMILL